MTLIVWWPIRSVYPKGVDCWLLADSYWLYICIDRHCSYAFQRTLAVWPPQWCSFPEKWSNFRPVSPGAYARITCYLERHGICLRSLDQHGGYWIVYFGLIVRLMHVIYSSGSCIYILFLIWHCYCITVHSCTFGCQWMDSPSSTYGTHWKTLVSFSPPKFQVILVDRVGTRRKTRT